MNPSNNARLLIVVLALSLSACGTRGRQGEDAPPAALPGKPPVAAPKGPDKGDPQKRFVAALDLHRKNQIQEAEDAFTALAKDFPELSGPHTNLGIIYAKSNRRAQALTALNRAATLNPQNAIAFNWLGILYRESNDLMRAKAAYEKALSLKSDYALAHYNYAILLDEHLKRPGDALPHYKDYQRLSGKQDLKVMAWVAELEARGQPPGAAPGATGTATPRPAQPATPRPQTQAPTPQAPPAKQPERRPFGTFDDGTRP